MARRERGRGNWEQERWRGEEAGQARGQAGLAGPDCAARSRAFSLVEFPPRQLKCFLIALQATSGCGHLHSGK